MNILVIGNGFDLAHELPTKYTDFLFFCHAVKRIIKENEIDDKIPEDKEKLSTWLNNNEKISFSKKIDKSSYIYSYVQWKRKISERDKGIYDKILDDYIVKCFWGENVKQIKEILYLIYNNFWIEYFLQCNMHGNENWIDFENEISSVVKNINNKMHGLGKDNNSSLYDKVTDWSNNFERLFFEERYDKEVTYKVVRDKLENDLDKLIRVFEIYLTEYVEKIDVKVISPNIKDIAAILYEDRSQTGVLFSKVISFNYTNIYEQIYLGKHNIDGNDYVDYIHGKADSNNTVETNNMVLGIDEYLGKKKRNKQVEFIAFKKFYQRIHKGTGCKYKEWVDAIKEEFGDYQIELEKSKTEKNIMNLKAVTNKLKKQYLNKHHVYFLGHSLDVTDKDILRDLILNDNVYTTIFYHNKDAMGQQIANLVKVIGQDELIRRTGGSMRTIEFIPQEPMVATKQER